MRFSASVLLFAGPLALLSSTLPCAAVAVADDEQEEAELEQELNSAIAEVASKQLKQEKKHLRHAAYHSDDYLRHRAYASFLRKLSRVDDDDSSWPSLLSEEADPVKEEEEEEVVPQKRGRGRVNIDPVAAEAAKRALAKEISYMRNIYFPSRRSSRHPMHRALRRPHRFSALAKKPHMRGFIGRNAEKLQQAIKHLRAVRLKQVRRQRKHYGRGHPGRHTRHRASLAASSVAVAPAAAPASAIASDAAAPMKAPVVHFSKSSSDVFPKSHPIVQRALGKMDGELKFLRGQRDAAVEQSTEVKDFAQKAHDGIKVGAAIRRKIAAAKADVIVEQKLVGRIQDQQTRLKEEHDTIQTKLHKAMDPRISLREVLVKKKKHDLEKTEKDVQKWADLSKDKKEDALETIRQRKAALDELAEAEEAMKLAAKKEELAKKEYEESKKRVSAQVQALNVYETKLRASKSVEVTEEEAASEEEISLDRTKGILTVELSRLDQALSSGEARLDTRLAKAKAAKAKAEKKLAKAQTGYSAWEKAQKKLADAAAKEVKEYEDQQKAWYHSRDDVMKSASDQAGAKATAESDWDGSDWAWSGGIEGADSEDDDMAL